MAERVNPKTVHSSKDMDRIELGNQHSSAKVFSTQGKLAPERVDEIYPEIESALPGYPFDQYRFYPAQEKAAWVAYALSRLQRSLKDPEWVFFHELTDGLPCLLGCKIPKWDEEHFSLKMASLHLFIAPRRVYDDLSLMLGNCLAWLKAAGVTFVSARVNGDHIAALHAFEARGFRYYDDVIWPVASCADIDWQTASNVRLMRAEDLPQVLDIAEKNQYKRGHFYCDERFVDAQVDKMYVKWVQTTWGQGEPIAVIESGKSVAGFFIFKIDQDLSRAFGFNYGRMRLLALDASARGKGLGLSLFQGAMSLMKDMGAEYIDSGYSTKNHLSARLHTKTQFYSAYEEVTFHLWI